MNKLFVAIIFTVLCLIWGGVRIVNAISFQINCEAYLERAANANTIELAKGELAKAIDYAERNDLTSGTVSIFIKNPKNEVGFWYANMVAAHEELEMIADDATQLEKTNVLMKLRESLTDIGDSGQKVTVPSGISIYPNNVSLFWFGLLSIIGACVFWLWWLFD
jgi:hypothetical protein